MPINEVFGWLWIMLGFLSGMVIGLLFHDEQWLGGYASCPRRLIRLGHISFVGLGILNILFQEVRIDLPFPHLLCQLLLRLLSSEESLCRCAAALWRGISDGIWYLQFL